MKEMEVKQSGINNGGCKIISSSTLNLRRNIG